MLAYGCTTAKVKVYVKDDTVDVQNTVVVTLVNNDDEQI
jgi:hypothetical protein